MSLKIKDQEAIAKLYTEGKSFIPPIRNDDGTDGEYTANLEHDYQDTWNDDLINSEVYQGVATVVDALRKCRMDDGLIFKSILSIHSGDKTMLTDALREQGVHPRHISNNKMDRGES